MSRNAVPRANQVVPGARVNIVLKADQPTGKLTQGVVRDLLTKGQNHPRGLKVRLMDGQIGRVQSIASESTGSSTESAAPDSSTTSPATPSFQGSRPPRYRDARLDDPPEAAAEQIDLGAYIVPTRRQGKGKRSKTANRDRSSESANTDQSLSGHGHSAATDAGSALATCPVCGTFEGDEVAVAHHVSSHFE